MDIRVWDYRDEYAAERETILAIVDEVFSSGTLILGPNVRAFEEEFAAYCGTAHGVGVDNATNGLFLALRALGVGPGDEVITVPNTAVPTATAIVQAGATPRLIDIDPTTALMDPALLEDAITPRTRAVIPVHLYGQCVELERVLPIAERYGLAVIEDCSQSHGARRHGRRCGSMGDAGVFSFYPTKPLGAFGDGGMVVTDDAERAEALRRLRFYGMTGTYFSEGEGYNSRLDEVQAAILRHRLRGLDDAIARRARIAARYDEALAELPITTFRTLEGNDHAHYVYAVRHPRRDELVAGLGERGIHVNISYPWPIHVMPGFPDTGRVEGDLPHAEAHAREVFSLPMYPSLPESSVEAVIEALTDLVA